MPGEPDLSGGLGLERRQQLTLPTAALGLGVSPDGSVILAACMDGSVLRLNMARERIDLLARHESYASGVVILPGARIAVSGGYDGRLQWIDLEQGKVIRSVRAHDFWSWDLAASSDGRWVASVTGRYEAGGYRYEPASEREPSVVVFDAVTGERVHGLSHVPCVQAVAISPDGRWLAAGNLLGEIRVWSLEDGREASRFTTPDFTSWGVIKSHHYLGGVFAMEFGPGNDDLYCCGMGPMVDPMAGNGTQRWQRFRWRDGVRLGQTAEGESGQGLMEAFALHPGGRWFAMAGRLFQGTWNLALFDVATGRNAFSADVKHRVTGLGWTGDGRRLFVSKAKPQERGKDGRWPEHGAVEMYEFTASS